MKRRNKYVEKIERGWPGHFCAAKYCQFHRNTLLIYEGIKIVVSSVGKMFDLTNNLDLVEIGCNRYYETMVFYAKEDVFMDADVSRELYSDAPNYTGYEIWDERPANELHEEIVRMFKQKLLNGELL